jgi:hypothetical protein
MGEEEAQETIAEFWCYLIVQTTRIILIIGAAACFVIGGKMVAQDIVYHMNDDASLFISIVPFIPIMLMAPRYKDGKIIYGFIAAAEILIIVMNYFLVLR